MNKLSESLTSPEWWFTVVVAGAIVNLFAAYLKPRLDNYLSSIWGWWRDKSEKRKAQENAYVESLRTSAGERYKAQISCVREMVLAVHMLLMGIFVMIAALLLDEIAGSSLIAFRIIRIGGFAFGSTCFILSFFSFWENIRCRIALYEAIDNLPEGEKP